MPQPPLGETLVIGEPSHLAQRSDSFDGRRNLQRSRSAREFPFREAQPPMTRVTLLPTIHSHNLCSSVRAVGHSYQDKEHL